MSQIKEETINFLLFFDFKILRLKINYYNINNDFVMRDQFTKKSFFFFKQAIAITDTYKKKNYNKKISVVFKYELHICEEVV